VPKRLTPGYEHRLPLAPWPRPRRAGGWLRWGVAAGPARLMRPRAP
jgi:hypothetical protein